VSKLQGKNFEIKIETDDNVCLVELSGYLTHGLFEEMVPLVEERLAAGFREFVFDLADVSMLESPAVACILTLTEKIVDDFQGHLVYSGLSDMHVKILEMVGVFLYANFCKDKQEAILECKA